jgi:hypothetical protein
LLNDGTLFKNKGIKFTANNYKLKEIKIFSSILIENYSLKTSIVKTGVVNQYNLYFVKSSKNTLKDLIKPFIPNTLLCKLIYSEKTLVNLKFRLAKLNTKNIQVEVTDINTKFITIYDSIRKAALTLKIEKSALLIKAKNNKVFRGKYLIKIKR